MRNYLITLSVLLAFWVEPSFCNSPPGGYSLMNTLRQADHFKGFIDLPTSSLNYALSGITDSTAQTFIQFGLAQIYYHPDRAKIYSQKLQAFLHTHPLVADEQTGPYGYLYGSVPRSRTSDIPLYDPVLNGLPKHGIDRLLDLLPDVDFYKTVWGILSLCCTLIVLIITTLYVLARKNGTTFTLILNHDGQATCL